jgi:hypothetical protein
MVWARSARGPNSIAAVRPDQAERHADQDSPIPFHHFKEQAPERLHHSHHIMFEHECKQKKANTFMAIPYLAFLPLLRFGGAFEDQAFCGGEFFIEQGQGVAQMIGVAEVRSQAGAQFGFVDEFVGRGHVFEGKFRA